jgi:23S rRNA (guanosine2251-2'-O)-methyltransferase
MSLEPVCVMKSTVTCENIVTTGRILTEAVVLTKSELRAAKVSRDQFITRERRPIRVVLDGVTGNYNIGAIFRLCDAMMLERLIICNPDFNLRKRRLVHAAQGAQYWVPWEHAASAEQCVTEARESGYQIAVIELTSNSIVPSKFIPRFPLCLVIGGERSGVSQSIVDAADVSLMIPMEGMSNSLNLATAAAIVFYEICKHSVVHNDV